MVEAECHRCGREWDYTGRSNHYGTCPNCKTSVKLPRGSERAEPEAERCPDPSDRTGGTVEIEAGAEESREVTLAEAVEAMDRSVMELYALSASESEAVGEVVQQVEERGDDLDDLRDGLEELAGYFQQFIEEVGGEVEYRHIEETGRAVPEALENVEMGEFEA